MSGRGTLQLSARGDTAQAPAIAADGLVKRYGEVRSVNGIDLRVATGEVVALLGPNGAGKSTLVDMVLGLTTPDEGEVRIFGQSPRAAVAGGVIGAMLQEGGIVEDVSIRELLTMFAGVHRSPLPVDRVLAAMDIGDIADRRGKLSGGQRQRLRLAIALVSNPRLLLLDEPTAAMDVGSRRAFWAFMHEFTGADRTVLFATHYLEEAEEFADRVVLVQDGVVIADGSVPEISSVVAGRTLTAVVPGAALDALTALPG
jgi:ABC-2 type transport system ATP-binding protein